jgi:protein-disulfide isomerase
MNDLTKKILLTIGIIIVSIPLLYGAYALTNAAQKPPAPIDLQVTDKDWSTGNKNAKNVMVEYGDLQCPACGAAHPYVKDMLKKYGNDMKFVFRHFPLTQHRNAINAAMAAEAAGVQNKFWEMHDMLYEHQNEWSELNNPQDTFVAYAKSLKLDVNKFKSDLTNATLRSKINSQLNSGNVAGVDATPTFFLNGVKLDTGAIRDIQPYLTK